MTEESSTVVLPPEISGSGSKISKYGHIYSGRFKDKNPDIRTAGILTYEEGDNVYKAVRQPAYSAPNKLPLNIEKYSLYRYPGLGETRYHYGHANDPKYYKDMTHGMHSDEKSFKAKDCVNPDQPTRFQHLKQEMAESIYQSNRSSGLGRVPRGNLPPNLNPYTTTFGMKTPKSESAKDAVSPDKARFQVELESSDKHDMYVYSHKDYEPGEQKDRQFSQSFDRHTRFGERTEAHYDGRHVKQALVHLPLRNLERRTQYDTRLLDDFREKHTDQLGAALDPNKETRCVGEDHTYGLLNTGDNYNSGDVLHNRSEERLLKGKDKERAHVAVARSHLSRFNLSKFKTLVDAFKFYDRNKDGFIDKLELKNACALSGFPITDDYLSALFRSCDVDGDDKISFVEFSNFLCFKESMKTGIEKSKTDRLEDKEIRDDEGRFLLKENDLEHKFHVQENELVPKTISNQLDKKVGNWKTTYDIINDAPFRLEPLKKRVYGIPSIRNDIVAPEMKKIQDKTNYGNDGNVWSLITPSVFTQHGIYENDVLRPRTKEEIHKIFTSVVGHALPHDLFDATWNSAKSLNPYGEVSVEEFRNALDQVQTSRRLGHHVEVN